MLELYFLLYRIPKTMAKAARERHRSAWRWSLIGVGVWLFTELLVAIALTFGYVLVAVALDWPEEIPRGFSFLVYLVSLVAAVVSVSIVQRRLLAPPKADLHPNPPPPPPFHQTLDA